MVHNYSWLYKRKGIGIGKLFHTELIDFILRVLNICLKISCFSFDPVVVAPILVDGDRISGRALVCQCLIAGVIYSTF